MLFNVMVFTYFGRFLWFSKVFPWLHMVSGWFSLFLKVFSWLFMLFKLTIVNNTIFLPTGSSYAIISDCRQLAVQRCDVCAVSFKSIEYHAEGWKALEISL